MSIISLLNKIIVIPFKIVRDKTIDKSYAFMYEEENKAIRIYEKDHLRDYKIFISPPTQVSNRIFLGSAFNAASYDTLLDNNIKMIINVTNEISNYFDEYFIYHRISVKDNGIDHIYPHLSETVHIINNFLNNNEGNILIHCYMGSSRSATIVAHYLSKIDNKDIFDVIRELKLLRPSVNPTTKFLTDLLTHTN